MLSLSRVSVRTRANHVLLTAISMPMVALVFSAPATYAADQFERVCIGKNDTSPVFVSRDASGALVRMDVTIAENPLTAAAGTVNNILRAKFETASREDIQALCGGGVSVAILPMQTVVKSGDGLKVVTPQATLPSSFTITTSDTIFCKSAGDCSRNVYGNFWVPGTMPETHNAQLVDFTVAVNNFQNAANGAHLVNSLLTVSDSNIATDFDGKGVIFGYDSKYCGTSTNPTFGSVAETWVVRPDFAATDVRVFSGPPEGRYPGLLGVPPTTCAAMSPDTTHRFLVGANREQFSQHYRYLGGAANPEYPPIGANFEDYVVKNSFNSIFRPNGAGIMFIVASGSGPGVPMPPMWNLTFSSVSARTQP